MTNMVTNNLPKLALFIAVFFWGSSFIAMKHAVLHFDAGKIILFRMIIASVVFLCLFRFWGKIRYQKGDWVFLAIMAVCEPGLYFLLESQALRFTTAGQAATVNSLQPPIVALLAWVFLKETPRSWTYVGFLLCIVGAVGLSLGSAADEYAPIPWLGNLLELGAMAASGVYIILLKRLSDRYSPFFLTALQAFFGVILFLPFAFTGGDLIAQELPTSVMLAILYLGTFVTFGGYFFYNWGIAKTSAVEASIYLNLIPVFGIALAFFILAERPSLFQIGMVGLIITGVLVCELGGHIVQYFQKGSVSRVG